ncbi:probable serine/threonine-protein kinase dyrk1 isoform X3 [Episyrphus balteatus]|uniref:probable serine/threonine-protein kinase dyrk1 isoform X3 n=1 Tax=Episyrphus balteatus TaxID=286459 RepID=UPI002485C7BC|nr:probable serine/threonine-protein kinase dyrk1 isoform X3 [Episyrphus balteatus]
MANTSGSSANTSGGGSPYDKIIEMIQRLDLQDDGIVMNHKIKSIECDFCSIVRDENMLNESMEYINEKALYDPDTSLKFALLFSSRNFDSLAMNDTKVRSKMLKILEVNFCNAERYRTDDKNRLYNSITLLGEYYHRVRLADNSPITILGQSLLGLLTREIDGNDIIDVKLAKLILSQVTLNGDIMRVKHKDDLTLLLFHVRRNLIEQNALIPSTKALLLMTLDLYYSNFADLGHMLEEMYTKYLVEESECDPNNYVNGNAGEDVEYEDGQTKKWSELVSEDSFYENDPSVYFENLSVSNEQQPTSPPQQQRSPPQKHQQHPQQQQQQQQQQQYQQRQNHHPNNSPRQIDSSGPPPTPPSQTNRDEEQEEQKPLPRWRAPRFNRPDDEHSANNNGRNNRRFSGSYDDDHHSSRSEGGSNIRLYSINDRLRHSQTKSNNGDGGWERNNGGYRNFNGNSRGGRGNGHNGGNRNNYRNTYDPPPRFQKAEKMRNSMEREQWRNNYGNNHHDDENSSQAGGDGSRSSSRARTLPRPPKGKFDSYNGGGGNNRNHSPSSNNYRQNNRPQNSRNFSRSNRYSSQSSLTSETSGTWDRRHHRRNFSNRQSPHTQHNEWEDTHSVHGQPEEENWDKKDNNIIKY